MRTCWWWLELGVGWEWEKIWKWVETKKKKIWPNCLGEIEGLCVWIWGLGGGYWLRWLWCSWKAWENVEMRSSPRALVLEDAAICKNKNATFSLLNGVYGMGFASNTFKIQYYSFTTLSLSPFFLSFFLFLMFVWMISDHFSLFRTLSNWDPCRLPHFSPDQ